MKNEITLNKEELKESAINYLKSVNGLNEAEAKQFIATALAYGLNPLKRELYAIKYSTKFNIITNYEVYLKRADSCGLIDYYNIEITTGSNGLPEIGTFTAKRKDWSKELKITYYFKEWTQNGGIWNQKPFFMFEKCILANGLRRLIPNELGNMPYINEELWYQEQSNNQVIMGHIEEQEQKPKNAFVELKKELENE